tara:strand:+ start:2421 stop:3032 length:612 start_codon:yes stop_codon:yes gene_type:complete
VKSVSRRCKNCRKKVPSDAVFTSNLRSFCSFDCLSQFTKSDAGKKLINKSIQADYREKKKKLKTKSSLLREAQAAFNAYVRARDCNDPCISCGKWTEERYGGGWDCGHYRSIGSAPHLRFNLHNAHKQCVRCNRYLSGSVTEYRMGLIKKSGREKVEALESINSVENMRFNTIYLTRIKYLFKKKLKLLQSRSRHETIAVLNN